jgi:hypothetical protein
VRRSPCARANPRRAWLGIVCGTLVLLNATGCTTWRTARPAGEPSAGDATYDRARVVLRDSTRLTLRDVVARADSVVGFAEADRTRVAVARPDVARVETRQVGVGRTIGLVGGVLAVVAIAALVAVAQALSDFTAAPSPAPSAP